MQHAKSLQRRGSDIKMSLNLLLSSKTYTLKSPCRVTSNSIKMNIQNLFSEKAFCKNTVGHTFV